MFKELLKSRIFYSEIRKACCRRFSLHSLCFGGRIHYHRTASLSINEDHGYMNGKDNDEIKVQNLVHNICNLISTFPAKTLGEDIKRCHALHETCSDIQVTHQLLDKLLQRYEHDWKSALSIFKWADSLEDYKHTSEASEKMVDILGKARKFNKMWEVVEMMRENGSVTLTAIAKAMRRVASTKQWDAVIKIFDTLDSFGLEKNTESMNLLLDTLCKGGQVDMSRDIFMKLKSSIAPNAHTFNIFVHGWCMCNKIDEALWTIEEMKGHGVRPSVVTYTAIIEAYCRSSNFQKVYNLLDEMQAEDCRPNCITFTCVMHAHAKVGKLDMALNIPERMKLSGCKPDLLFYNALIHVLGKAGRVEEASHVFKKEMVMNDVAPNASTYNTLISMYCHHSLEEQAFDLLKEMEKSKSCKPDLRTYMPLLKWCFKKAKTDDTLSILLSDMVNKHHLGFDDSVYTLLIHGLCKANKHGWAYSLFEEMVIRDITPRNKTYLLLLEELKQHCMFDAAEKVEALYKGVRESGFCP